MSDGFGRGLAVCLVLLTLDASAEATSVVGEIVVLDGDPALDPMGITQSVLGEVGDAFDQIWFFTTFADYGDGTLAWFMPVRNSVKGIGIDPMDTGFFWGSGPQGRLSGVVNMKHLDKYGDDPGDPDNAIHAIAAQEFAHQWAAFTQYLDADGEVSDALLGREGAHWASTVDTGGSVLDGGDWVDLGGGQFQLDGRARRFSPLDQYLMGLRAADEVPPFWRIAGARYLDAPLDPDWPLPDGVIVTGTKEEITIDQIVTVHGPRIPDASKSQKDFRVAIALVTRPGDGVTADHLARLEAFRTTFETVAHDMSDGRMRICTRVTANCDVARLTAADVAVTEIEGNGDGVPEPGETLSVRLSVRAVGFGSATDVRLAFDTTPGLVPVTQTVSVGSVAAGDVVAAPELRIRVPATAQCGDEAVANVRLWSTSDERVLSIPITIGAVEVLADDLSGSGWVVDPYGTDTATAGAWAVADTKAVDAAYLGLDVVTQPARERALVTGPAGGQVGEHDLDGGRTTALSPTYAIDAVDPVLTFWTWRSSWDLSQGAVPLADDALVTEISVDGGANWVTVDVDTSNTQRWERKRVRLRDVVLKGFDTVQLRVTIADEGEPSLLEAMVDDVRIVDASENCVVPPDVLGPDAVAPIDEPKPPSAGSEPIVPPTPGCVASGHHSDDSVFVMMLGLLALLVLRRSMPLPVRKRRKRDF